MAPPNPQSGRPWATSPRTKHRDGIARNTLCRNVVIYGHCRHEKDGCMYSHERSTTMARPVEGVAAKQRLNVDSPAFTPAEPVNNKITSLSPNVAHAAIFTPAVSDSVSDHELSHTASTDWSATRGIPEFVPRNFQQQSNASSSGDIASGVGVSDPFTSFDGTASPYMPVNAATSSTQVNPYATEASTTSGAAAAFYQHQQAFQHPLQYHLYAPIGPHREHLLSYQKTSHDFFIPENLRQEFQRRNEATMQILPNLNLPATVEHYHSLVPLDTTHNKSSATFGYNTWTYKATSSKDGLNYVIRRLEGFRLTNEKAIYGKQAWKRVESASVVTEHDCFTTRAFGDSSLVFITDYHPLAKTLAEHHLSPSFNRRVPVGPPSESILWSYAVQIITALRSVHANGLAARCIVPSKVLLTGKNRIRLNACGVLDVIQFDDPTSISILQQDDFRRLGQLLLILGTASPTAVWNSKTQEALSRIYTDRFRQFVGILLETSTGGESRFDVNGLMSLVADQAFAALDETFHLEDTLTSTLNQELENGRLVRLMAKLGCINERPEYQEPGSMWVETGEKFYLKLFRDYVFHQVSPQNNPVVDLGHIITCLNKLDAGSEEKVTLTARDDATVFIVSFRELRRALEATFQDLLQASRRNG